MATAHVRMCGRPLRRILFIKPIPVGKHGGKMKRCYLECGHDVLHCSDTRLKVGRRTGCHTCE